jgi:hypothetical protein
MNKKGCMEKAKRVKVSTPYARIVSEHGPAVKVSHFLDHKNKKYQTRATHTDGFQHTVLSKSAAEAYELGGRLSWVDTKKRTHPAQQGSYNSEHDIVSPEFA